MTLPTIFFAITTILSLILCAILYYYYKQPLRDYGQASIQDSQEKSLNLLRHAIAKARELVGSAETESLKIEEDYKKQFAQVLTRLEGQFSTQAQQAEKDFLKYLTDLKTLSEQNQNMAAEFAQKQTVNLFERFEQNLTNFLTQTQQQSTEAVQLELKASRQLIDTYKAQQMSLIDESVIAILEKTLSLVLEKKLTLGDNVDLVNEALEKAKAEKLII